MRTAWSLSCVAFLALAATAAASDHVGVYAVIDKVVLTPNETRPERAQVWGVFALAIKTDKGNTYDAPAYGYLDLKLNATNETACRREWNDLRSVAGKDQAVAFGQRYALGTLRVRPAHEKSDKPDPHPLGFGLTKLEGESYALKSLKTTALPAEPATGAEAAAGAVTLRVRNVVGTGRTAVKYEFEIQDLVSGAKEPSGAVVAGSERFTEWTPKMKVKAGQKYTWSVRAVIGSEGGPVALATFQGKAER